MKTFVTIPFVIACCLYSFSQNCGDYIELIGEGIYSKDSASLIIPDGEDANYIVVEALYKSQHEPSAVKIYGSSESLLVEPKDVLSSGSYSSSFYTVVYNAKMKASTRINLDILSNKAHFYSLAAYIYRPSDSLYTNLNGELYHVYKNADDPLSLDIEVPISEKAKDVKVRFGISELNNDSRYAIFKFYAGNEFREVQVQSWESSDGETDSYTIKEVNFNALPGDVDKIVFSLISDESSSFDGEGDSYVAGVSLLDLACKKEVEEVYSYCSYTQRTYGRRGGRTCSGYRSSELLNVLLEEPLTIGHGNNTLTIDNSECVIRLLPGGNDYSALARSYTCKNIDDLLYKRRRLRNSLLAQTLTLGLNLRNDQNLKGVKLKESFIVQSIEDCEDPIPTGIPGTEAEFGFDTEIINYLGNEATASDLYDLANQALGGVNIAPLTLQQVSNAAELVNEAFEDCKLLVYKDLSMKASDDKGEIKNAVQPDITVYPIPVRNHLNIEISDNIEKVEVIFILNLNGQVVETVRNVNSNKEVRLDNLILKPGVYLITVYTGNTTITKRVTVL